MSDRGQRLLALHLLCWDRPLLWRRAEKLDFDWKRFWEAWPRMRGEFRLRKEPAPEQLLEEAEREWRLCRENGIIIVARESEDYPELLRQIWMAPRLFFYRGDRSALKRDFLAVVGSRRATGYSQRALARLLPDVVRAGVAVVSGLAYGADALAHRLALELGGTTLGVTAGGLLAIYPAGNRALAERMLEKGGVLSEAPLFQKPLPFHFPRRNRLISGIAKAVLITEAAPASGSLVTARLALEQNREVLAVPGSLDSPLSAGPNGLIRAGAKPVLESGDILEEFGLLSPAAAAAPENFPDGLAGVLLEIIKKSGMITLDELACAAGCDTRQLLAALTELEMRELITEDRGIIYDAKK